MLPFGEEFMRVSPQLMSHLVQDSSRSSSREAIVLEHAVCHILPRSMVLQMVYLQIQCDVCSALIACSSLLQDA